MMIKIVLVALALVSCHALTDNEVMDQWNEFQAKFRKSYKSPIEAQKRLLIFKENLEEIEQHNALYDQGMENYSMGVNQFTDWTNGEWDEYVNQFPVPDMDENVEIFESNPNFTAPSSVDWREQGLVATPQNQGSCGSCWSFSSTGALEGQAAKKTKSLVSYSKQNLVDCCRKPSYQSNGCKGGLMTEAFRYVKAKGIKKEANYAKYSAKQNSCNQQGSDLKISSYKTIATNDGALVDALATVGPISVAINSTKKLAAYKSGIFSDPECNKGRVNHGVLAIGYGSEDGKQYWIIKNSWGTDWGEKGYFKLKRGGNTCLINSQLNSYPVL